MKINNFRDLVVWQNGIKIVKSIYHLSARFPKEEKFCLTTQMRRSAISTPSNIAEGHTREHRKEFLYHISVSQASSAELLTQLEIAVYLKYCKLEQIKIVFEKITILRKQLYKLRNSLSPSPTPQPPPKARLAPKESGPFPKNKSGRSNAS